MPSLIHVDGLEYMEQEGKWDEIHLMLLQRWNSDRKNVSIAIRLATTCWYALVEPVSCKDENKFDYVAYESTLNQVTEYGLKHYMSSYDFLWIFGYMIVIVPFLFFDNEKHGQYDVMREFGYSLLRKAVQLNENDVVASKLLRQAKPYTGDHEPPIDMLILNEMFPENTEMERYFKSVLGPRVSRVLQ